MPRTFRTRLLCLSIALVVIGAYAAGPPARIVAPAGAQAPPAIQGAGLFTFPGDWSKVPESIITVFYPSQASWQFVTSAAHKGSKDVLAGTPCLTCHTGQEKAMGEKLVKPSAMEPDPVAGKRGTVDVSMRAAFDDQYIYMRFEWAAAQPGASHTLWRYDGTRWVTWGGPKPDATKAGIAPSYEDRLALMIADRNVQAFDKAKTGFNQAGCFIACHNSLRKMPQDVAGDRVRRDPFFGTAGRNVSDMRHYLLLTRTALDESGGWDKVKTAGELERFKAEGSFLDLWQWRAARSSPIGYASDDYILEYRLGDAGTSPFTNPPRPSFMYDPKGGMTAIPEARFNELLPQHPLVIGRNAVPLDPNARFAVGDLLPQYLLRTPTGSAADIQANGSWRNGKWTVELRRRLNTGNPDDKAFRPGRVYRFGLSLFDDKVSNRYHLVSFVQTLGLGEQTTATVKAVRIGR